MRRRQRIERRRPPRERLEARTDDDTGRLERRAVVERDAEAAAAERLDTLHETRVDVRDRALLERVAVREELADRHRQAQRTSDGGRPVLDPQAARRLGDARCACARAQQHVVRHVLAPEAERATEDSMLHAGGTKVGGDPEAHRAGAEDDDRHRRRTRRAIPPTQRTTTAQGRAAPRRRGRCGGADGARRAPRPAAGATRRSGDGAPRSPRTGTTHPPLRRAGRWRGPGLHRTRWARAARPRPRTARATRTRAG